MVRTLTVILAILLSRILAYSQNPVSHNVGVVLPELAILDIAQPDGSPDLHQGHHPSEVVQQISLNGSLEHECWVNYSSLVRGGKPNRKVVASVGGVIPEGISVAVEAADFSGNGKGKTGISAGKKHLSELPEEIISDIGSCYTGKGSSNGHLIRLTIEVDQAEVLASQFPVHLMVTYRITD